MEISSLSSSTLKSLISLVEKKEKLSAELAKIDLAVNAALGGGEIPVPFSKKPKASVIRGGGGEVPNPFAKKPRKPRKPRRPRKGRRGALKEKIVAELQAAGKAGVSVKELAAKLGVKSQNVHVWFSTTGKTVGAKKIAPGKYAL